MEFATRRLHPGKALPTGQAMRNLRGGWFENLISVVAWNSVIEFNKKAKGRLAIIAMPQESIMQFWELYDGEAKRVLDKLFSSLSEKGITLTLSNPDFLCVSVKEDGLLEETSRPCQGLTLNNLRRIRAAYEPFKGKCSYNSINFGLAVKSTIRPDRRYQIVYEGSLLKAIVKHLRTVFVDRNYVVPYYGMVSQVELSDKDKVVFTNPTIDSITDVDGEPRRAVDEIVTCETVRQARNEITEWLRAT